ncbi:unnamed protein product, partial [Mesorhabditis belari]|uniref:Uncharacterized protein n=1 Tax=Mesorhabditis belari TaxID=2138241 RepID=A0AAF3EG13_9BILA
MTEKLPPGTLCAVCEDQATGNHYNVASCNGCKTFFRRAIVNKRNFACMGNGNCPVTKGVRCTCRHCRLQKCLAAGMDINAIQNDRDRIGYTKRTRKSEKSSKKIKKELSPDVDCDASTSDQNEQSRSPPLQLDHSASALDPLLDRLTSLENNFTLLLSRGPIEPYKTLDEGLATPSRFHQPIDVKVTDPIVTPKAGDEQKKMPFWRSRIIALYLDWAKTFSTFRTLPQADKIALITNHASSYMIMCEAFRTPDHTDEQEVTNRILRETALGKFGDAGLKDANVKDLDMIRLPTEYGSLPADYGGWLPPDYGRPSMGNEGRSTMHTFFDPNILIEKRQKANGIPKLGEATDNNYPIAGSLSGLTPVMACVIDYVMRPFRQLNISTTEFAVLQAIMFFDPDTEGLDAASQRNVNAEQRKHIAALHRYVTSNYGADSAHDRFTNILLRIPTIRKVAAKKNESLQIIDLFNLFTLNSLVKETVGIRSNTATPNSLHNGSAYVE